MRASTGTESGHRLAIRFDPLPLFRTGVRYEDIEGVEVGRRRRGILRVGSNDAENLALFLRSKIRRGGSS